MGQSHPRPSLLSRSLKDWFLKGAEIKGTHGPGAKVRKDQEGQSWWKVMCLTGVDYFSTLGYQPGIAFLAAGLLSPLATLILVLVTLFGALPIYRRVAEESPFGEGSIAMLEHLLDWWQGKLFVLTLLGFAGTDFIITITLSAADASAHLIENPFAHRFLQGQAIPVTLFLVLLLAVVFLIGFKEAIGIAVVLVSVYLILNTIVILVGLEHVIAHPGILGNWQRTLFTSYPSPIAMVALSLLLFPQLALGLSGFETGVSMMPLVKGDTHDDPQQPHGKIKNTHSLLTTAAMIMSVALLTSSLVTTLLIPADAFRSAGPHGEPPGPANGRALAFLAHQFLGNGFGTVYDLSTIAILWFAGASAMAGLLNIVPRYLPRYGMAPEWARAARPLVLVYTVIAFAVTIIFRASVDAQGGAYATGVLVLMSSAAVAVTLSAWKKKSSYLSRFGFAVIALVFGYTTVVNVVERPDGVKIAAFFICTIVFTSLISRVWRTTELRVEKITLDPAAKRIVDEMKAGGSIHIIANDPYKSDSEEYAKREQEQREDNRIPSDQPVVFLEIYVRDPSDFSAELQIKGLRLDRFRILRGVSTAVPNGIAAFLLYLRDETKILPHAYFNWTEGNPFLYLIHYVLSGQGEVAPVTREVLRKAERNPEQRPAIHAGV
ncbi:MAG: amino acid transporter [Verrucomicrobia bacterium]|nr:amino acid transporter [Verrucomicrobiota bacterium]